MKIEFDAGMWGVLSAPQHRAYLETVRELQDNLKQGAQNIYGEMATEADPNLFDIVGQVFSVDITDDGKVTAEVKIIPEVQEYFKNPMISPIMKGSLDTASDIITKTTIAYLELFDRINKPK